MSTIQSQQHQVVHQPDYYDEDAAAVAAAWTQTTLEQHVPSSLHHYDWLVSHLTHFANYDRANLPNVYPEMVPYWDIASNTLSRPPETLQLPYPTKTAVVSPNPDVDPTASLAVGGSGGGSDSSHSFLTSAAPSSGLTPSSSVISPPTPSSPLPHVWDCLLPPCRIASFTKTSKLGSGTYGAVHEVTADSSVYIPNQQPSILTPSFLTSPSSIATITTTTTTRNESQQQQHVVSTLSPVRPKRFALKIFHREHISVENCTGLHITTLREMQVLQSLPSHPNIVHLHGVCSDHTFREQTRPLTSSPSTNPFLQNAPDWFHSFGLLFEYVPYDLQTICKACPCLPLPLIKFWMNQLIIGLSHLENNHVLHRDIKPANILITDNGTLRIADFGLARYTGQPPDLTRCVATLHYRAPEVLFLSPLLSSLSSSSTSNAYNQYRMKKSMPPPWGNNPCYDIRGDVWSAALVWLELLSGRVIFPGETELAQVINMFEVLGVPSNRTWDNVESYPLFETLGFNNQSDTSSSSSSSLDTSKSSNNGTTMKSNNNSSSSTSSSNHVIGPGNHHHHHSIQGNGVNMINSAAQNNNNNNNAIESIRSRVAQLPIKYADNRLVIFLKSILHNATQNTPFQQLNANDPKPTNNTSVIPSSTNTTTSQQSTNALILQQSQTIPISGNIISSQEFIWLNAMLTFCPLSRPLPSQINILQVITHSDVITKYLAQVKNAVEQSKNNAKVSVGGGVGVNGPLGQNYGTRGAGGGGFQRNRGGVGGGHNQNAQQQQQQQHQPQQQQQQQQQNRNRDRSYAKLDYGI